MWYPIRITLQPLQYLKGYGEFYKLKFKVTSDVLIPRPETELLVDEVLKFLRSCPNQVLTVLDVGTGSGCIAISIAKNYPNCRIIATDISHQALKTARQNAKFHRVENQIRFLQSDLLSDIPPGHIDIVVANLPYIPSYRIPYLDSSVKDFEPHIALDGGADGFDLYRKLFRQIRNYQLSPELIIAEIDYTQDQTSLGEAGRYFPQSKVKVWLDLYHRQRILSLRFNN